MPSATASPLAPQDWVRAATLAVAEGGIANISVERLARSMGTTKGSFYWHFKGRPALVAAVLEAWEAQTEALIARTDRLEDRQARIDGLFRSVFDEGPAATVELALLADADDPRVAAALERVTTRRLGYLEGLFEQEDREVAEDRALVAYTTFLGLLLLRRADPDAVPIGRRLERFVATLIDQLLA